MRWRYFFAIGLLLAPQVLAQGLPDLGDSSQSSFSAIEERRLGEEIMREVRADRSYTDDPEPTDYLNRLGNRIAASSADSRQEFTFFLMQDRMINAFALPGGYIGVNTGLLLAAQSESEVASVIAHEIAHVTQRHIARILDQQKQSTLISLATLALAVLASRANSDLATAASAFGQGAAIQNLLNFTREHEKEADRVGLQTLQAAGFDARAMATFFERLQRATRIYEYGSAPSYLRTHPMTQDRIADVQNRVENLPYRQITDSLDFQLVRAKLKADSEPPAETRAFFEEGLAERRFLSEAAVRYGLATTLLRQKNYPAARKEYETLKRLAPPHPMVESLGCRIRSAAGETEGAIGCYQAAARAFPQSRAITYEYAEALLQAQRADPALKVINARLQFSADDSRLYMLQARAYALQGKRLAQHRATGEAYVRMGNLRGAIEQLQIAVRSGDGDFYQLSATEARLRELRKVEEARNKDRKEPKEKR
jgi:predicted Zn-dependent protease